MSGSGASSGVRDWKRAAEELISSGQYPAAEQHCRQWRSLAPQEAEAHCLSGILALEQRQVAAALGHLEQAVGLDPGLSRAWVQMARALSLLRRTAESLQAANRGFALQPADALSLDTLGVIYSRANQHQRAAGLFRQAAVVAPDNAGYQFNLASALKFLGDFEGAEAAYESCLNAEPEYWKAYPPLSQLRKQTAERNHRARYEAMLPRAQSVDAQLQLRLALAKECEDLGQAREAFQHLLAGKSAKRASLGYDSAEDAALFASVPTFPRF